MVVQPEFCMHMVICFTEKKGTLLLSPIYVDHKCAIVSIIIGDYDGAVHDVSAG